MAGIYNIFEINFEDTTDLNNAKCIADSIVKKNHCMFGDDFLAWESIEVLGNGIRSEDYYGFRADDLQQLKKIFISICKGIIAKIPDSHFMGRFSFDYSNVDHTDYLIGFYRNGLFDLYEGQADDGDGFLTKHSILTFSDGQPTDNKEKEYVDVFRTQGLFNAIQNAFDENEYPELEEDSEPDDNDSDLQNAEQEQGEGKFNLVEGQLYSVQYKEFSKGEWIVEKLVGTLDSYWPDTYGFETVADGSQYVEESDVVSAKKVSETEETHRIQKAREDIKKEIKKMSKEILTLSEEFRSLYDKNHEMWGSRSFEKDGIIIGRTYEIIERESRKVDKDAVLVTGKFNDGISDVFIVRGCTDGFAPKRIFGRQIWNRNEFKNELLLDDASSVIQKKRMELIDKQKELFEQEKQLKTDYIDSFK